MIKLRVKKYHNNTEHKNIDFFLHPPITNINTTNNKRELQHHPKETNEKSFKSHF